MLYHPRFTEKNEANMAFNCKIERHNSMISYLCQIDFSINQGFDFSERILPVNEQFD